MTFSNTAILGLQWGDEGKGKIVNYLAGNFGAACRYQGGHYAGHSLRVDGKKKDDLQEAISAIKAINIGLPIDFVNFRD